MIIDGPQPQRLKHAASPDIGKADQQIALATEYTGTSTVSTSAPRRCRAPGRPVRQ
jgi:hypothetical protein